MIVTLLLFLVRRLKAWVLMQINMAVSKVDIYKIHPKKELFVSTNNKFIASSLSVFVGLVAHDTYYRGMRLWISS